MPCDALIGDGWNIGSGGIPRTALGDIKLGGELRILAPEEGLCKNSSPSFCLSGVPESLGNPNSPQDGL